MIGPIDGSLSLRRARPADENFRKNLFYEARRPIFEPLDLPERETVRLLEMQWAARLADYSARYPNLEAIIVQNGADSVGCLLVDLGDVVTVVDICIQREHRGRGTGARVLAALLNRADHEGLPVQLVVEESNPASRLYRRLGFEEAGRNGTSLAMRREPQAIRPGEPPASYT